MLSNIPRASQNQLKRWASLQNTKFRREEGLFLAEGVKVVEELLKSDRQAEALLAERGVTLDTDRRFVVNSFVALRLFKDIMAEHEATNIGVANCMGGLIRPLETPQGRAAAFVILQRRAAPAPVSPSPAGRPLFMHARRNFYRAAASTLTPGRP